AATGADCLAVSIGNVHLLTAHEASVDLDRLKEIHARTNVPLVIHGGTSFPPGAVPDAISNGVAKFNVGTILKRTLLDAIRAQVGAWTPDVNVHDVLGSHKGSDYLVAGKAAMKQTVSELMRLYGS